MSAIKTLTWSKLQELSPCSEAVVWGKEKYKGQESQDSLQVIQDLMIDKKYYWANWLIVQLMDRPQYLAYIIRAAEEVLPLFEKEYPNDNRPRKVIETVKEVLKEDTEENRKRALEIYGAVYMVAYAARATTAAAYAALTAAFAAAAAGAQAARARAHATFVTRAMTYMTDTTEKEKRQIKILNYGIELMKENLK